MRALCLFVVLVAAGVSTAMATTDSLGPVVNKDPTFTLTLPSDLKEYSGKNRPEVSYIWEQRNSDDHKTNVYVVIENIQGELPRGPLDRQSLGNQVDRVYTQKWKNLDINVFVILKQINSQTIVTRNAAVPLKGNAIKLQVSGPDSADAQMEALLTSLLAGLEGQTSWVDKEADHSNIYIAGAGFLFSAIAIGVVVYMRHRQMQFRRRATGAMHMPH